MKRTHTILCLLSASFLAWGTANAGEYEDLLSQAENSKSLNQRMELWNKASEATPDEAKKLDLYEKGFDLAKKTNNPEMLTVFAQKLLNSPKVSPERKASATFGYLNAQPTPGYGRTGLPPEDWEAYLQMPARDLKNDLPAMRALAAVYHSRNFWFKEIAILKKVLDLPNTSDYVKQDVYINLSNIYLEMNDMDNAMECLKTMLKMKTLTPQRRARTYMLLSRVLLKGYGFYYQPSDEQYKQINEYCILAMNQKKANAYNEALVLMVNAAHKLKKDKDVVALVNKYASGKKVGGGAWMEIKNKEASSRTRLEEYDEAFEIYEMLYKYKYSLADTCMALGYTAFFKGDYAIALGMYDEAIVELGPADDARPAQCKHWVNRIKGMMGVQKRLKDLTLAHQKRLNEEAKAQGKGPVVEIKKENPMRPFGEKKKPKKPQTLQDIEKGQTKDLLEDGLDL